MRWDLKESVLISDEAEWPGQGSSWLNIHRGLMIAYIALFSAPWAGSLHSHVILHEWLTYYSAFKKQITEVVYLSAGMAGATWNCWHLGASLVYTIQPCHFMQSQLHKVCVCLAVTCHLHFWQNDQDLLRATAVIHGWNGFWNKCQHRKSTVEKNIFLPLLQGFKPATFQSWVQCSNHWAILTPWVAGLILALAFFDQLMASIWSCTDLHFCGLHC